MLKRCIGAGVPMLLAVSAAWAVTVTINHATEYQTIEGFGAHGSQNVWWSGGPFADASFVTTIVDDLGLTMSRNEFYPDFEPSNENGDANSLDFTKFNFSGEFVTKQKIWIDAMKAKAEQSGEPIRFIATYWSPPAWMKQNSSTVGGDPATNVLRTGVENELAEYGVATVRAYKERCNVDLYALSMQNESAFDEPYNSCVYTATRYRDVFKIFGARVKAAYPNVRLFGAEDMLGRWTVSGAFPGAIMSDTTSRRLMDAIAVHGYSDGVNPTPGADAPQLWNRAYTNMRSTGKPLWMTETSGYSNDWSGARGTAEAIFEALKYGKVAAWVWWQLAGDHTAGEILMPLGQRGKLFYAAKQYFRYIRPGAVMVDVNSDDTLVFTIGFNHKTNHTLTLVILNWAGSTKDITLSGQSLPSFTAYRTSSSDNCTNAGTVTTSASLPANSITTLYGTNYNPPVAVAPRVAGMPGLVAGPARADVYALDGRAAGRAVAVRVDEQGRIAWDARQTGLARGSYLVTAGGSVARTAVVDSR